MPHEKMLVIDMLTEKFTGCLETKSSESDFSNLLCGFEEWLRSVRFQKPTLEAYDLAKNAWIEAAKRNNIEYIEKQFYKASEKIGW